MSERTIFRYPGGKSKPAALSAIKSLFPQDFLEYREVFVGGGGVFSSMPTTKNRWINDRNRSLIAVYSALQQRPREFVDLCLTIEPWRRDEPSITSSRGYSYPIRLREKFNSLLHDENADLALRYFFLNRTGFNGRVILEKDRRGPMYFSNPQGWDILHTDALIRAAAALSSTAG